MERRIAETIEMAMDAWQTKNIELQLYYYEVGESGIWYLGILTTSAVKFFTKDATGILHAVKSDNLAKVLLALQAEIKAIKENPDEQKAIKILFEEIVPEWKEPEKWR